MLHHVMTVKSIYIFMYERTCEIQFTLQTILICKDVIYLLITVLSSLTFKKTKIKCKVKEEADKKNIIYYIRNIV